MATRAEKQAELNRIQQEIAKLQRELAQLETDLANSRANPALADLIPSQERTIARTQASIATLEQRAIDVETQIAAIPNDPPAQSAAADVAASTAGATQNPAPPATTVPGRLTTEQAATIANNTETGTNAPVKTLQETQSVPPETTAPASDARPSGTAGAGANGEDGTGAANTKQVMAVFNNTVFTPKNNVLDKYASYTYSISWYLLTPADYKNLIATKKPNVANYSLLAQSGGAPTGATPANAGGIRNQYFSLDYYIDNLEIVSAVSGKGSGRAHNAQDLSFDLIEPAGITLITNLQKAVDAVYKNDNIKYSLATYCLVIRFYGYDENGNIVSASDSDNSNAVVEKFIPFYIENIKFRVASNRLVEYHVKAKPVVYYVGLGSSVGTIKAPIEISGSTVSQILAGNGDTNITTVPPEDGRVATALPPSQANLSKNVVTSPASTASNEGNIEDMGLG